MTSSALYFPYIDVPDSSWMARAILYWDRVTSIVPSDYLDDPRKMSSTMRAMLGEELVHPVVPGHHLYQVPNFAERYISVMETRRRRPSPLRALAPPSQWTLIHAEKLQDITDYLQDVGLARRKDHNWVEVEPLAATQFMAYLAAVLGALPEVDAAPITDQRDSAAALNTGRRHQPSRFAARATVAREGLLEILLPVPEGPLDVDRLRHFKARHGHQLSSLRLEIEGHCAEIADRTTEEARAAAADRVARDLQKRVAAVEDEMRISFGRILFGSIIPLAAGGLALEDTSSPFGIASATLSFAVAAQQAIATVRAPRKAEEQNPLAYVVRARQALNR